MSFLFVSERAASAREICVCVCVCVWAFERNVRASCGCVCALCVRTCKTHTHTHTHTHTYTLYVHRLSRQTLTTHTSPLHPDATSPHPHFRPRFLHRILYFMHLIPCLLNLLIPPTPLLTPPHQPTTKTPTSSCLWPSHLRSQCSAPGVRLRAWGVLRRAWGVPLDLARRLQGLVVRFVCPCLCLSVFVLKCARALRQSLFQCTCCPAHSSCSLQQRWCALRLFLCASVPAHSVFSMNSMHSL